MREAPFFSIVMPVYGVEDYLEAAVESVLQQTFSDFELILVDDCSTDKSGKICDDIATRDARVQVIHNSHNLGLSLTRNAGLEHATGKYIWFMDSDDVVDLNLLEDVWNSLQKNKAQIVLWGIREEYYNQKNELVQTIVTDYPESFFSSAEELRSHIIELEKKLLYGYAWNKIYDLSYLRGLGLGFEKITLIEDIVFNVKYCMDISSMNILGSAPYHYAKRTDGSLTTKFVPEYYELHRMRTQILLDQFRHWNMCTPEVLSGLGCMFTRYIYSGIQRNYDKRANMTGEDRKEWMRNLYEDSLYKVLIPRTNPQSMSMKWMVLCLKKQWRTLTLWTGKIIYFVKTYMPMIFATKKTKR